MSAALPQSVLNLFREGKKNNKNHHKRLICAANKNPNKIKAINTSSALKMSVTTGCSNQIATDEDGLAICNCGRGRTLL